MHPYILIWLIANCIHCFFTELSIWPQDLDLRKCGLYFKGSEGCEVNVFRCLELQQLNSNHQQLQAECEGMEEEIFQGLCKRVSLLAVTECGDLYIQL